MYIDESIKKFQIIQKFKGNIIPDHKCKYIDLLIGLKEYTQIYVFGFLIGVQSCIIVNVIPKCNTGCCIL